MIDRPVSTASGTGAVAVTPHHLATTAALEVMAAGGSAADGAIAADAVLGVVAPDTCGIGGDLFALVHRPGSHRPAVLNASGRGGSGLSAEALRAAGHEVMPTYHPATITVPGCVDGWMALSGRFGRLPLPQTIAAALQLALDGFATSPELAASLTKLADRIASQASAPELYPNGAVPEAGTVLRRPGVAAVLADIASRGRAGFYEGRVAEEICIATGGILTGSDLAGNRADWVDPIGIEALGHRAWTIPPNSQGYLALAAVWLFEQSAAPPDPAGAAFHHAAIEAYRAVAWERDALVADPDHAPLPPDRLLDLERLGRRAARLDPDRIATWPAPGADPGGTAYMCVIDGDGMGVSLIQSNFHGIGSGISAGDTGVWLHNRGAGFTLTEGHPNEAAPGKRPLHTLSPTVWTRSDGSLALLLGTRGGHQQPQYLLQVAALLLHAGLEPAEAQRAPRWEMDHRDAGITSAVSVEARMPADIVSGLERRGHTVEAVADWPAGWGPVSVITVDQRGNRHGAADPRVTTATAAAG